MKPEKTYSAAVNRPALLIAGILLIAANLRVLFTGIAPLIDMIRDSFALSTSAAGMLTTLPLLAFAIVSPFAVLLARKFGLERSLFGSLGLIALGVIIRSLGPIAALYIGTGMIGAGIAVGNVLLPSLVKRDFPHRIPMLTALYGFTMGTAGAFGSVVAVPLAQIGGGWRFALGIFVLLPLISAISWLPQLRNRTLPAQGTAASSGGVRMWRFALAWQVTLFLGLNSLVYYIVISWLPAILADAGYRPEAAGSLHGLLQLASAFPGLLLAAIVPRMRDQRLVAAGSSLLTLVSLLGLLVLPAWVIVWSILFGIGTGATIILALAFISLRTGNSHQAAALSGMAQCLGYLLAAAGPIVIGGLHDVERSWNVALILCAAFSGLMALFGFLAGRALQITADD
jgi:CP family cyanate transporter-like MFS transporter